MKTNRINWTRIDQQRRRMDWEENQQYQPDAFDWFIDLIVALVWSSL